MGFAMELYYPKNRKTKKKTFLNSKVQGYELKKRLIESYLCE